MITPSLLSCRLMPVNIASALPSSRSIAFASKMLTNTETRYANIYRERVPLYFGTFHTYIYGRHIILQNKHKPLEMTQKKPLHAALPRLQCMLLRLQKYDYMIQYIPGKNMVLADRLSRFPSRKKQCTNRDSSKYTNNTL